MLTDTAIRAARPRDKTYKLFDVGGLHVEVTPTGSKRWRLKYYLNGVEKRLSLGIYPHVTLSFAREQRDAAKKLLATGGDPSEKRKSEKLAQSDTFEALAREWLALQAKPDKKNGRPALAKATWDKALWTFEKLLFPFIGSRPISKIEPPEVLRALKRVENRGHHETCHRAKQRCGQVFRYAIATGRAARDATADLRGALAPVVHQNFATITEPDQIGQLLRAIDGYRGHPVVECALRLAPLVFVRPGELRAAEWSEISLDRAEWRITAERMKMREAHIVPLSKQAITILRELEPVTGGGRYVFPSFRTPVKPMSNNAITAALRRMGYSGKEMTGHGFRALASTSLNEQGWKADWIEAQLAHGERNKVRAAYNHAQYLLDRRKMMQAWADYLDGLRNGAKVVNLHAAPAA